MNPIQTLREALEILRGAVGHADTIAAADRGLAVLAELEKQEPVACRHFTDEQIYKAMDGSGFHLYGVSPGAPLYAVPVAPQPQYKCRSCGTHEVAVKVECHNSRCDAYASADTIHEGWKAQQPQAEGMPEGQPFGIIDPDYATAYTKARIAAWQYGYALTLHGSFTRDLDLVAVPWTTHACGAEMLVKAIEYRTGLKRQGPPSEKPHGRQAFSLLFPGFEDPRWVDLSIAPLPATPKETST